MSGVIDRICAATNDHDLNALVACFADDYRLEMPVHPGRNFVGNAQVRTNWEQIFAGVPDIRAEIVARADAGASRWAEWRMWGTREDGAKHDMRGITIFHVAGDGDAEVVRSCRFYLEQVEYDSGAVADDIRRRFGTPT